jgi:hypothetical protein
MRAKEDSYEEGLEDSNLIFSDVYLSPGGGSFVDPDDQDDQNFIDDQQWHGSDSSPSMMNTPNS